MYTRIARIPKGKRRRTREESVAWVAGLEVSRGESFSGELREFFVEVGTLTHPEIARLHLAIKAVQAQREAAHA